MRSVSHAGGNGGKHGKIRVLVASIAVIVVVAVAAAALWYRGQYHVWPGQAAGSRISYCGRDYQAGNSGLSLREIRADSSSTVRNTGGYPPLGPQQDLYAVTGGTYCPAVVFLKTGPEQFTAYALLGGP